MRSNALQDDSVIQRVVVPEIKGKDERYVHEQDIKILDSIQRDDWQGRASLLPPFDNLISGRGRTNRIFGFDYNHEMFLPKAKRKNGYYVLPILWGDKLICRIDPLLEKGKERRLIKSVYAELGAPSEREVASNIDDANRGLAGFLGVKQVVYLSRIPSMWRRCIK